MRNLEHRIPAGIWDRLLWLKTRMDWSVQRAGELFGLAVVRKNDYYSPVPSVSGLRRNPARWNRPSSLAGVAYDLDEMKTLLTGSLLAYQDEFNQTLDYRDVKKLGFGPGYNPIDALILYAMVRQNKPHRYLEVGSGLSTYYCHLAAEKNQAEGHPLKMTCVEPYPYPALSNIPDIEIVAKEVQDVAPEVFNQLDAGDILFIDSSHVLKIDGDVAYLYLEILPCLKPGVIVHIHDVPFPYNIPYPAAFWLFDRGWPKFWNEAMVVQALLCGNANFKMLLSLPLLRHFDEGFLQQVVRRYETVSEAPNTFSSLWIQRV